VIDPPNYYDYPERYAVGIEHVVVNGIHTVDNGEQTGERAGQVLRLNRPQ
jgi:hypothetical protein